jgi:hypothetical protein
VKSLIAGRSAKLFAELSKANEHDEKPSSWDDADAEVDKRVQEFMSKNPGKQYADGLSQVLKEDPELSAAYLRRN